MGEKDTLLDWKKSALLIIDMQADFAFPEGSAYITGTNELIPRIAGMAETFRKHQRPVIHVVRLYQPDGSNAELCRKGMLVSGRKIVLPGTSGADIVHELLPDNAAQPSHAALLDGRIVPVGPYDVALYKPRWGAFYQTALHEWLGENAISSLLVAGCNFPNCPRTTIYEASERDYRVGIDPASISGIYEKGVAEMEHIGVQFLDSGQLGFFLETGITLCNYRPEYQVHFERLNKVWLQKYYQVEPLDEYMLTMPEDAVLKDGGCILFACYQNEIIGTVGLKNLGNGVMEMIKMAVDESFQGLGAGKILCRGAIEKAREQKASRIILYSQRRLAAALRIYNHYGFSEVPLEEGKYKRADVMMQLIL